MWWPMYGCAVPRLLDGKSVSNGVVAPFTNLAEIDYQYISIAFLRWDLYYIPIWVVYKPRLWPFAWAATLSHLIACLWECRHDSISCAAGTGILSEAHESGIGVGVWGKHGQGFDHTKHPTCMWQADSARKAECMARWRTTITIVVTETHVGVLNFIEILGHWSLSHIQRIWANKLLKSACKAVQTFKQEILSHTMSPTPCLPRGLTRLKRWAVWTDLKRERLRNRAMQIW